MSFINVDKNDSFFAPNIKFTSFDEKNISIKKDKISIQAREIYNDIQSFVNKNPDVKTHNIIRILDNNGSKEFEISEVFKEKFGAKEIVLNYKNESGRSENLKGRASYRTPEETQKLQFAINYYVNLLAEQRKKEKEFIAKNSKEGKLIENHRYNQFTDKTPLQEAVTRIQKQTIEFLQKSQTQKRSIEQERSLKNQLDDADILKERALEKGLNVRRIVRVKTEST